MARVLYDDAGLDPGDMDLWYMYDGFSFFVLQWLENLGLVDRGQAGAYVDEKALLLEPESDEWGPQIIAARQPRR